jgi:Acetyltransferase (GNAT) domain
MARSGFDRTGTFGHSNGRLRAKHERTAVLIPGSLFEGSDLMELYQLNPDPLFAPRNLRIGEQSVPLFQGRIRLSSWVGSPVPLPLIPVCFLGSPVTDVFPATMTEDGSTASDTIRFVEEAAVRDGSWAIIVKDLPAGHFLEQTLFKAGFQSTIHEPVWYCQAPESLTVFLSGLSRGRRRGLEGSLRKFRKHVSVRPARDADLDFVKNSYDTLWQRSDMRLEQLPRRFFAAALSHPSCLIYIFEANGTSFAFDLLWQKEDIWFDKYIGTDTTAYREYSFYSMSMLHMLDIASARGIKWYVAGQGSGKDKAGLGFKRLNVNLWIKPLVLRLFSPYLMKRFSQFHNTRIYTNEGGNE